MHAHGPVRGHAANTPPPLLPCIAPHPTGLANCSLLSVLDLSHNSIQGSVPAAWLSSPSKLQFINLAGNQLSGPIPSDRAFGVCVPLPPAPHAHVRA
jgi:hypothetical protein